MRDEGAMTGIERKSRNKLAQRGQDRLGAVEIFKFETCESDRADELGLTRREGPTVEDRAVRRWFDKGGP
jgi:hypothetical protein